METISIIIPCYNEEEAIPVYYETMVRQMNEMEEFKLGAILTSESGIGNR